MKEGDVAVTMDEHAGAGNRLYFAVWIYLLAITAVEVVLAYLQVFSTEMMLVILVCLSMVKAGLIVAYFMHLKFERPALAWSLVPAGLLVISLLFVFFPDSFRVLELGVR
jgi:cytochrome c oxidase subunit IV